MKRTFALFIFSLLATAAVAQRELHVELLIIQNLTKNESTVDNENFEQEIPLLKKLNTTNLNIIEDGIEKTEITEPTNEEIISNTETQQEQTAEEINNEQEDKEKVDTEDSKQETHKVTTETKIENKDEVITKLENKVALTTTITKINRNKNYKILKHYGWVQQVVGDLMPNLYYNVKDLDNPEQLISEGIIKVRDLGKGFFNINTDFRFKDPELEFWQQIKKQIKIRNKETYYFDHPSFGAFLNIQAIEKKEEELNITPEIIPEIQKPIQVEQN